jgi:cell division protein FtsB
MATIRQLQKENDALQAENEELKRQYNELRDSVIESYDLLTDDALETEGSDEDSGDEDE